MEFFHRPPERIATWRLVTSVNQEPPKLGYSIGGLPHAIMDKCQDRVPQRPSIFRGPASARRNSVGLRRPVPLGTLVLVPTKEIGLPYHQLAMPEKNHQAVFIRAVRSYTMTSVRRMIRQTSSDRQDKFQKLWRNPLGFDIRSLICNSGRAGADVDRKRPLQGLGSQERCRIFFPRPEANGNVALDLLDRTYGLWPRRIAPHALNDFVHAFRNKQKFSRGNFHAFVKLIMKCGVPMARALQGGWSIRPSFVVRP